MLFMFLVIAAITTPHMCLYRNRVLISLSFSSTAAACIVYSCGLYIASYCKVSPSPTYSHACIYIATSMDIQGE